MRMLGKKTDVRSLAEDLEEVGLNPEVAVGQITRTTNLVGKRLNESYQPPIEVGDGGSFDVPDNVTSIAPSQGVHPMQAEADELEEAFKIIKKMFKTAGEKMKAKLGRKKRGLAKLRRAAKMYRKKNRRKIKKRMAKKLRKFGKAGLERLHKSRKRVVMSAPTPDAEYVSESRVQKSRIAQLREDLNAFATRDLVSSEDSGIVSEGDEYTPYEDAAMSAGLLALELGDIFEAWGDTDTADTMYSISEEAADLSEMLEGFGEGDELDESEEERLMRVLEGIEKALRVHEEMGSPLVSDIVEFRLENDDEFFAECMADDDDEISEGKSEDDGEEDDEDEEEED